MSRAWTRVGFAIGVLAALGGTSCEAGSRPLSVPSPGGATGASGSGPESATFTPYRPPSSPTGAAGATGDTTMATAGMAGGAPSNGFAAQGGAGFEPSPMPDPAPPPVPVPFCAGMPSKPLPYAIASDFTNVFPINAPTSLTILPTPDCDQSVFPDVAVVAPADAGADAASSVDAGAGDASADATSASGAAPSPPTCFAFRYRPDDCWAFNGADPATAGTACWAGFIFAATPFAGVPGQGICIAPGATTIHFKARASRAGARVKFGSIRAGLGETEFYLLLTTSWADYSVSIPGGESYNDEPAVSAGGVWNAFSIVVEPADHLGGTYVFVSDVVWAAP